MKSERIGERRVSMRSSDKVGHCTVPSNLMPQNTGRNFVREAHKAGIRHASVFSSVIGFQMRTRVEEHMAGGFYDRLTICVERIDDRGKRETFFEAHRKLLKDRKVVFQEVEVWGTSVSESSKS